MAGLLERLVRRIGRGLSPPPSAAPAPAQAADFDLTDLPDPRWLWSKGYARLADVAGPPGYWRVPTEAVQTDARLAEGFGDASGLVWVRLGTRSRDGRRCDLDGFVAAALPAMRRPFVLITTDGDAAVPSELAPATVRTLLDNPWLVAWYTQNWDGTPHPKLFPIAIGLDLHTPRAASSPRQLSETLGAIAEAARPATRREPSVFCDLGLSLASEERRAAVRVLSGCRHVVMQRQRLSQAAIWESYARHRFVLSAPGNGLDSHRTWEALYLGAIVIAPRSPLDRLYAGLAVVSVEDWRAVRDPANLARWLEQYGPATTAERRDELLDARRQLAAIRTRHLGG